MSLFTALIEVPANDVPQLQGEWRQFVLDHLSYIAMRSRSYDVSPEVMNLYRYDLVRFIKERLQRRQNMASIILLLNNMDNDFDFSQPGLYIIPEDKLIQDLYSSFLTTVENQF